VNNVGASTKSPGTFRNFSKEEIVDVLNTNILPVTELCRYFLLKMELFETRGIIINISSLLYCSNVSYGAIYIATKAYITSLTRTLTREAKRRGIEIQLVSPSFVSTKINKYSRLVMNGFWTIPNAKEYAKQAVDKIGVLSETSGYFWHGFHVSFLQHTIDFLMFTSIKIYHLQHAILKLMPWQIRSFVLEMLLEFQEPVPEYLTSYPEEILKMYS